MFLKKSALFLYFTLVFFSIFGQHKSTIDATLNSEEKIITIHQKIEYHNTSKDTLYEIQFMDWANAFSNKTTPLAVRFNEDFRRAFHFSSQSERGYTEIFSATENKRTVQWKRNETNPDVVSIDLLKPLAPNQKTEIDFNYKVKIPDDRFTDYGYGKENFKLRYWHLAPAIYTNQWQTYSHKNLNDFNADYCNYSLNIKIQEHYLLNSNLIESSIKFLENGNKQIELTGSNITNIKLFLDKEQKFLKTKIDSTKITTDIPTHKLPKEKLDSILQKVYTFSTEILGKPTQENIILDHTEYKKQPVYGFTQLPEFLRPFEKSFQFEMISLKQLTKELVRQNFKTNLREKQWISDALQVYTLIKYVETFYPETKMGGRLHKIFGINWLYSTRVPFNEQYYIGAKNMPARFKEQPLSMPKDSLLKFNYNISNPYKAGMGLHYLESYFENKNLLKENLKNLASENALKYISENQFTETLFSNSKKEKEWFVEDYISNNKKLDVSIRGIKRKKDSLIVKLKNKGKPVPVKISGFKKDSLITEHWTNVINDTLSISYSKSQFNRFIIDKDQRLPEVSRTNNYYKSTGIFNKKVQLKLFQDLQNPKYHQVFVIPEFEFDNVIDGIKISSTFFNKPLIRKNYLFSISPAYGLSSKKILGSLSSSYTHQLKDYGWYLLNGSIGYGYNSYAKNDNGETFQVTRFTPSITLSYRPKDLRKNLSKSLRARFFSIQREINPLNPPTTPNYNVFAASYNYINNNLTDVLAYGIEFQQAQNFNKLEGTFHYRKLFLNNQQVNLRLFAGTFITNNTITNDGDYFSFGVDRPTDYLFKYAYLTQEENDRLESQQYVTAEGNFKSRLNTRFANQWIATASLESSIWNWIYAYGDTGFVKNRGVNPEWIYDSGIKFNLVQDYFELYFPLQSSIGFEPTMRAYPRKIRFKVTLSINTLLSLFTREWY